MRLAFQEVFKLVMHELGPRDPAAYVVITVGLVCVEDSGSQPVGQDPLDKHFSRNTYIMIHSSSKITVRK